MCDGSCLAVPNRNFWESVVRNAMPLTNITSAVITTNRWRRVFGFDGAIFDSFISHHFQELGISRVAGHGLGLACRDGILDFALGEAFVTLADGLDHCHGCLGLHVDVREAMAHTVFLLVEGDLFAMRSGDDPIASGVVADRESVCLQLGEGEKVRDAVVHEP